MEELPRVPELGADIPRRGNLITRTAARLILRLVGWRFEGELPNFRKAIVIVAPHTSNWDFLLGVVAMFALGARFSWLGKRIVFLQPLGLVMRWLGGIPVDRSAPAGVVEQIVDEIRMSEKTLLALSPEGTRSPVQRWRTGFWRIAHGANIPIVPIFFDFGRRVIGITPPFHPTDDIDSDLTTLHKRYDGITPCRAAGLSQPSV